MTQESLAEALELSTSVINRIENNKRKMDVDLVYKLSTALEMDISQVIAELFNGKNTENSSSFPSGH
ncbi:transcriptional regulator with XRE-family HTH domain [Dyadobacter arcticus]|uniref:Transcriptional regulator with XRE-family HTH domain n=2 Tax=Dyadobacter arcticus TaxID=1078754 RepID=A0ABX0URL7_9BACT|nr:transcriptional regulator with XRE-family HTH domain [Dyadobacter arcticus]